jgi:deoxycytidine triphosphate deaminase
MIIVGTSLEQLALQFEIVDRPNCFDNTCLSLSLGNDVIWLNPCDGMNTLVYGESIPDVCIRRETLDEQGLLLPPHSAVLASSWEVVKMPPGYMGFLQTKGSLARLMVSVHFSDGQIDSGFDGKITFEIFNGSEFNIRIHKRQKVANLYILKTSTLDYKMYAGRYNNADGPTIQIEEV